MPPCLVPLAGPVLVMRTRPRKGAACPEEQQRCLQHRSPCSSSRACQLPVGSGHPRNENTRTPGMFAAAKGPR